MLTGSQRSASSHPRHNRSSAPCDRVIICFGQGRGGSNYYALDVTNKNSPQIAKVSITGASQNMQKLALIIGGGYDSVEERTACVTADSVGNHVYMVGRHRRPRHRHHLPHARQ